jgi:exodeoxyribonuclease VII large subunit
MIPNKSFSFNVVLQLSPSFLALPHPFMSLDNPLPQVWSVSALNKAIADSLKARFSMVTVQAEISGFTRASSGHCYFNLKDSGAQIRCALFRRTADQLNFVPRDGQLVQAQARVAVYEPRGEMQLVVEALRPAGLGQLHEAFLQLKAKLEAQGLFAQDRKRVIPLYPRAIGVVTSLAAAALHDVVTALKRRVPHIPVIISPSPVQGADAPQQLVNALQALSSRPEIEVILLVRGGGSLEDLWAFNDEHLAHAITNSSIPVISGVGHAADFTIADFCADLRAPTPTAAAELCAVSRETLWLDLQATQSFLAAQLSLDMDGREQRLDRLQAVLARPSTWANKQQHSVSMCSSRLARAAQQMLSRQAMVLQPAVMRLQRAAQDTPKLHEMRLSRAALLLRSLDPALVLQRGYAWLENAQGQAIASVEELQLGEQIQARLADGSADMQVITTRRHEK